MKKEIAAEGNVLVDDNGKKALLFGACAFQNPHSGLILEEAEELMAAGYRVTFCYCDGVLDSCFCNPYGNRAVCAICRCCQRHLLKPYSKRMRIIPLRLDGIQVRDMGFEYHDNASIKKLEHHEVKVGYAALSNYVSLTRNAEPKVDDCFRDYFSHILNRLCAYVERVERIFDEVRPEVVSYVTGRNSEQRPFFDIAKARGIHVRSNEFESNPDKPGVIYKIEFEDALPHSIELNRKLIEKVWNESSESKEAKWRIGRSFYEKRASGQKLNSLDISFTSKFRSGMLPENLDSNKKHIVIYNSSEDEFVAVGTEFDSYSCFQSQFQGITIIMEALKDSDCQVFLRIHPNLMHVRHSYHVNLHKLQDKYRNLTVIPADSPINSYDLLKVADKVVVFGSTMGAEAAYMGKPVILLGGAYYLPMGICYVPESKEQAISLIKDMNLAPIDNQENVIKFGYYVLKCFSLGHPARYVDISNIPLTPKRLFGKFSRYAAYMKLFGSKRFMSYLLKCSIHYARKCFKNTLKSPDKMAIYWYK